MPGLVPGIHVLRPCNSKDVDAGTSAGMTVERRKRDDRAKPGHDAVHNIASKTDVDARDIGGRKQPSFGRLSPGMTTRYVWC